MMGDEIFKRSFRDTKRDIYFWFRYRRSGIDWLDRYFRQIINIRKLPYYSGGDKEQFSEPKFEQIRGHYLVRMVHNALRDNYEKGKTPHTRVQKYLLEHDPHTYASELPVFSAKLKMSGFIDLIRVLDFPNEIVEIVDFKPGGSERGVEVQLQRYRYLLAERLQVEPEKLKIAWLSEEGYYKEKEAEIL